MTSRIEIIATEGQFKMRLDDLLFDRFQGLSKMYLREIVKNELCEVNGRPENIGYRIKPNDLIEIFVDESRATAMRPEDVPLDVRYEDGELIVVNKPSGMLVHPTHRDKNGTLLNALSFYLNSGDRATGARHVRAGLIHRLDKQTSGLMVVAKTSRAHRILAEHFKRKIVKKRYMAMVDGVIGDDLGTISAPIGRFAELKQWNVKDDGKPAETRFWVTKRNAASTLVELEPVTGRTNQLRIHCASIGHPIVGDVERGGRENARLLLHAWKLAFRHPSGGRYLEFECPADFDDADHFAA